MLKCLKFIPSMKLQEFTYEFYWAFVAENLCPTFSSILHNIFGILQIQWLLNWSALSHSLALLCWTCRNSINQQTNLTQIMNVHLSQQDKFLKQICFSFAILTYLYFLQILILHFTSIGDFVHFWVFFSQCKENVILFNLWNIDTNIWNGTSEHILIKIAEMLNFSTRNKTGFFYECKENKNHKNDELLTRLLTSH